MTETIKPFGEIPYTQTHNIIYDYMMRRLSGSAFKVLSVIVRFTFGWHKQHDTVSYSQIQEYTGISSRGTVSKAISDLLDLGYIVRLAVDKTNMGTVIYSYSVNTDLEIEQEDAGTKTVLYDMSHSTKIVPGHSTKIVPGSGTKIVPSKETKKHQTNDADDDILNCEQLELNAYYNPAVTNELVAFGIDATTARKLSEHTDLETVTAWIEHARANDSLKNPQGFVVSRLRSREKPPQLKRTETDRQRRRS